MCVCIYMHIYVYIVYICIYICMYCVQRTYWALQTINVRCIRSFLYISYIPETRLESRIIKADLYFISSFIKLSLDPAYTRKAADFTHLPLCCPVPFRVHGVIRKSEFVIRIWTRPQTSSISFLCHLCWPFPFRAHCVICKSGFVIRIWTRPQIFSILFIYVDPFHFVLTVWYVNQGLL